LLRQIHYEIVRESGLRGGDDVVLGNIREAVADVVPDGVVEEDIFLSDDGDLGAERTDRNFADVEAVDANRA
jgi:hypothetical protein